MSTVQEALKAREKRKKAQTEAQTNKINSALESYKKRKKSNSQSAATDLAKRINAEIETIKTVSSPSWGKGTLGSTLESTRESRLNLEKLQREVESYKSYLDAETYNSLSSTVSKLREGYNSHLQSAEIMDMFDSEDSYTKWYEKYKKEEDEKNSVLNAEDFGEYSQIGKGVANPDWNSAHAPLEIAGWTPFGSGETINNMVTFAEANRKEAAISSAQAVRGGGTSKYGEIVDLINTYMKDDEKAIYNYYVGKGDTKKAEEYLTNITDILRQRQAGKIVEQIDNTALELVFNLAAGTQTGFQGLANSIALVNGGEGMQNSTLQHTANQMRENNTGVWQVANDLVNTTGNMTPAIIAGGLTTAVAGPTAGKVVGSMVTGISSAGNSYAEMIAQDYGVDEARKYGLMVGAAEGGLSYLFSGISSIGGKLTGNAVGKVVDGIDNGIARFFADVALNMGSEAIEEATQEALAPVFKMIATGEDFEGIDWSNVAYSALLGALSAGALEGVPRGAGAVLGASRFASVAKKAYGGDVENLLIEAGTNMETGKAVDKYIDKYGKKGDLSKWNIAHLVQMTDAAKIKGASETKLNTLGEQGDVSKLSGVLAKQATGRELSKSEQKILEGSTYGQRVANALDPEKINSGKYDTGWSEKIGTRMINAREYNKGIDLSGVVDKIANTNTIAADDGKDDEGENKASEPAKITIDKDGETVEVKPVKITAIENDDMSIELEGGEVVDASKVDFGEGGIGLVYQAAKDMASRVGGFNLDTANVFVGGYNEASGQSAGAYIDGWISAYKLGALKNPPPLSALAANPKTAQLSEEQRKSAYNFGRAFGNEKIVNTVSKNDANISKTDSKKKKGRVVFDGAKYGKTLNERQRASLKAINFLAKALGKDIYVENLAPGENGWYDPDTGDIHIGLNAGALGESLLLFTTAHELTHDIRARLSEKFNVLADAVFEEYTKRFGDHVMEDLIDAKIDFLKEKGDITENMTEEEAYDIAYEEVICDCLETMLVDSDAIEALSKNIYAKDKTLWQRIKDFFARIAARIKAAYEGVDPDSEEGQRFRDLGEGAERIKKLWVEAIVEMSETDHTTGEGNVKHSYSSIAYSFFGDKKVSIKDLENGSYKDTDGYKRYVDQCLNNMRQTSESFNEKASRKEIVDSIDGIVEVAVAMKKAGYDILDSEGGRNVRDSKKRMLFSSLEPNSDYFTSSDISTICDKRINFAEIYDEIVRREDEMGVPKNKRFFNNIDNYFVLHKILADKGLTAPCRQCYVESMRKNLDPMANAFIELMQETDPNNKANKQLYQPSGKSKGELKSNNAKLRENLLEIIEREQYDITADKLTIKMLTTADGLAQLKLQAPLIYEAFNSFYGQSKPKMPKAATPFRFGELTALLTDDKGKIKTGLIKQIVSTGGFRLQSYSDFQIQNFADVLQVIFEAGTLGLNGHAYTKVPAFLDATKGTNLKRNISIFMYKDGGQWKIDRGDSFPYALEEIYDIVDADKSGNTGIIAVVQNEDMAAFIMANDNIGYFIPFHKSGVKMGVVRETIVREGGREIKGYSGIKDHTRQQTEVWAKTTADHKANTKVKKGINIYEFWDFDNAENLSKKELIKKNVMAYIDACNEAGYLPKFREYVTNNSKVLNAVLTYSKKLGFVSENATIDDISFEYSGYRIPYGYYKCLGDFGMFTPDGEAAPIERLSLKGYNFGEAVKFFSDAESLRRNEILQQFENGTEREKYRNSDMTTAELAEEVQNRRDRIVDEVVSGEYKKKKYSHTTDKKASYSDRDSLGNVLTKEQQEFFKDSKARDEDGNLYVLYHGTSTDQRITTFMTTEAWRTGLWLSTDHATAVNFARLTEYVENDPSDDTKLFTKENSSTGTGRQGVYELYANLKKPLIVDAQGRRYWEIPRPAAMGEGAAVSGEEINAFALKNGYDGVIINDVVEGSNRLGTDVIAFYPNQVKYTDNLNPTEGNDIRYSHKADKKASYAPTFYSHMGKVIDGIRLEKMGAGGVVSYLKGKGVKDEEIKWSGIETFLEGKKSVTKAELVEFVAGSQLVIEEDNSGINNDAYTELDNLWQENFLSSLEDVFDPEDFDETTVSAQLAFLEENGMEMPSEEIQQRMIVLAHKIGKPTRWEQYKLDGGTNYREIVFKMPNSTYSNRAMRGHWGQDAEGVLVHARIQDFDVNGKKMLFIEELQSDWHNEGREKGYSTPEYEDTVAVYNKLADEYAKVRQAFNKYVRSSEFRSDPDEVSKKKFDWLRNKMDTAEKRMQDAERDVEALKKKGMGDVADAPFRENYHEYVLKRLLRMAAEEGYDSIGWTIADTQSKRWSYDYEKAYQIEYDQEMPKFLRKYGKKWGATVGNSYIRNSKIDRDYYEERIADIESEIEQYRDELDDDNTEDYNIFIQEGISDLQNTLSNLYNVLRGEKIWSMDITDSMKDSVLYEGQPKYSHKADKKATYSGSDTSNLIGKEVMLYEEGDRKPDLTLVEVFNERTGKTETTVKFIGDMPKDYIPQKVAYCYKLFEQHPDETLHALFAGASNATPIGEWQYAKGFPYTDSGVKGMNLRERYGWHLSAGLPSAPHLMSSKSFERGYPSKNAFGHPKGSKRVWVRMAYDASTDFNSLADSTKEGDIFGLIPFGGYYAFKENNHSEWVISSGVKIDKILTEEERQQILKDAGYDEYEAWRKKHRATEAEKAESKRQSAENKKAKDRAKKEGRNYLSESAKEMREAIKSRIIVNPELSDIKHQHTASNGMKPRTLLANALEGAVTEDERNLLQTYKENIDKLNTEQAKLEKVMSEIDEIRYKKSLSILGEEMSVKTFESRARAKAEKNGINAEDVQFKLDRSNSKYVAYAVGHGTILEADKTFRSAEDNAKLNELWGEAKDISTQINTYDRELLKLQAMKPIKDVLQREKAAAYKRATEKAEVRRKESVERVKESAAKTQRELMNRYQESRKRATEGRNKTALRHKIKDVVNELNQYLLKGTKDKHVPIELQKAVAEALDAVNMDTVGAEERIAKKRAEMMSAKTPEAVEKLAKEIEHIQEMGGNMEAKISRLKTAYDSIINSEDPLVANSFDDVISNTIDRVMEVVGETPLRDMSLYQLEAVYDMYRMVLHSIRAANKAFKAKKSEEISVIANRVLEEVDKLGKKKSLQTKAGEAIATFDWNNLKPVYAFERIGSETFTEVYENVRAGEDTWAVDMTEAQEFREKQYDKYNHDSWDFGKKYDFTSTTGQKFSLTLGQIMSLYAYSKRGDQAKDHLKNGGFVFDGLTEVKVKGKLGITRTYQLKDATAYKLGDGVLDEIIKVLDSEELSGVKDFADAMQDYLSTVMGEKGNEVSLELYGVKLFKEKNYFPLKSAPQYLERAREQAQGEVKIKNKGFTKETTPKAKNPIVLTSFMDVWAGHVNEMSMYHAFTLALEDFYRVFNYKTPASETLDSVGVIPFIENAHGGAAVSYIDQLLKDLNGGARSDPRETVAKALMSRFKKSSVMASLSVVVQQPTAIIRAMALVDAKYFGIAPITRGVVRAFNRNKHKALWSEVKKYAPVAIIKEMGYFDTGMGKSSVEWLKGEKTFMDKVDDVLTKAPAVADELAWISIWEAVKRETAGKNPGLKTSSEEFLKLCGERFTEVITKTQVYDSTLAKSANMRSKSGLMNMWTAFMAEPTTSLNMVVDAFRKGNKKYAARVLGSVVGSVALNAALVSLVYAMRDDDEDETYLEKYLSRVTTEFIDGINPVTYIPFLKDIWSIMQGFDIERADMALITDLVDSLQSTIKAINKDTSDMSEEELTKYQGEVAEALFGFVDSIASLTGIPVKNFRRDINGIINLFKTLGRDMDTSVGSITDNIVEDLKSSTPIWGWLPSESKGDKLYDAIISGDTAYVDRLKSGYKDESAYNTALRKALRENDPRIREAAEARYEGDIAEYKRIAKEIIAEGRFDQDNVVAAINSEINAIKSEQPGEETSEDKKDEVTSIYSSSDINTAFDNGDTALAKEIIGDLIDTKVANGKTEKEAKSSLRSSMTSYWKPLYINASESERIRIRKILYNSGLYGNANEVIKSVNAWLKD